MTFFLPDSVKDEGDEVTITYKQHKLGASVLGVDIIVDFILDGKDENGNNVVIVTKHHKTEPFVAILN